MWMLGEHFVEDDLSLSDDVVVGACVNVGGVEVANARVVVDVVVPVDESRIQLRASLIVSNRAG